MEIKYLTKVVKFFKKFPASSEIGAYYVVRIEEVAETLPPSSYQPSCRLEGNALRDVFYIKMKKYNRSDRIYFYCDGGTLYVLMVLEDKRRTQLTDGEKEQIMNSLKEAKGEAENERHKKSKIVPFK